MMFNLPLPGGTTGHAIGIAIAAIVLGPWGAILAISIALAIQALFFGDGGITALGANCFNMAIVGSLVAYGVYRAIAANTPIDSKRRVFAAAAAGYISINVAALLAAIELGLQPMLYRDAAGSPLYAPYALKIALPAMMIGHLAVAGIAETILAAGVVAYLQRAEPQLLKATSGQPSGSIHRVGWSATKPLWASIAILLVLTPLGILAAGKAWGEWSPADFTNPQARQQIAAASLSSPLPVSAPAGLEQLAAFWIAPMPRYAPTFLHSPAFGYMLSAAVGTGLVVLATLFAGWLLNARVKS
jgi:cobalt/nickel transport system permease protein